MSLTQPVYCITLFCASCCGWQHGGLHMLHIVIGLCSSIQRGHYQKKLKTIDKAGLLICKISDGPKMARAVLRRQFVDGPLKQYPRKPQSKFYAIGLHFLRQTFLMTLFYHSSTIYTALIFLCPFNHPYLSILFTTYSIFGLYFAYSCLLSFSVGDLVRPMV